jgi:hypothetical protein
VLAKTLAMFRSSARYKGKKGIKEKLDQLETTESALAGAENWTGGDNVVSQSQNRHSRARSTSRITEQRLSGEETDENSRALASAKTNSIVGNT